MTDTDLITADDSTENEKLSSSVTSNTANTAEAPESSAAVVDANTPSGGNLSTMVLPELRALANRAGVKGTSGMRKNELIAAIRERQSQANGAAADTGDSGGSDVNGITTASVEQPESAPDASDASDESPRRERRGAAREAGAPVGDKSEGDGQGAKAQETQAAQPDTKTDEQTQKDGGGQQGRGSTQQDEEGEGRQGRRGRRFRERRRRGERAGDGETELREDDVVQPVAGILDVLDNYAFVRTSGYLPGPHDVYVSMNMVRKNGLRRGDAVTGAVRVPKDGEQPNQRQKFNPLVRLDSVNGGPVEDAKKRPDFNKLTPLYPNQRLRLETTSERLTTRVIDLIMPIGKGQRALIVSPPKAGKTTILQDIANAITQNNPECHLMVVLVDERPEEVTDMQRSVKGEVIASTFDRPPSDHTSVAELAIERAKRLVEQGKDVVVLLDSITRLGRAYNNASPASGRILSGGVDSTALYPPKRFLGAARNIEEGGSLTIIATAMVETGSTGDTVIFEEFKGTGNAELKLDRKISERRVFPAVDVNPSGTRKDELLLSPDEFAIVHKLRRVLSGLDSHQAIDLLLSQLRKTKNNYEFLVQVSKTTPGMDND
ncbi:transcription termination factor Rho [Mycobacterium shimoidei]|uniref:Transcription termination factor Rho n=1 Tax=Mycobacterium shimoidei TaxID=29313 RepID=A0A1E3THK8_MYCSH|nr:transcription termination factor Rho [Mycobacterium shimoidei]MCV7257402.1 transcription termination factor Rho [Mycobacterium shimoidei]ODR13895.1 transcription termination factor Rho [Mycobacterium shimoidei]ORW77591.1 transcription termination factor Rho [Mycobacterium shimoidei]SRX94268.1 putative transcription termination factor Rho [Mycobacterium tuberculosis H37Rv] [Mycobacterium shimoidei]